MRFLEVEAGDLQESLKKTIGSQDAFIDATEKKPISVLKYIKDTIVAIVPMIAIGAFLYIGGRLFVAKGNPEEFKGAMMQLIYLVIWIFFVTAAWALISIISWISL